VFVAGHLREECENSRLLPAAMPKAQVPAVSMPALDEPVRSPCISVCRMDATSGYCEGCWRTIEEIARWSAYSEAEKRAVWLALQRRQRGC